MLYLQADVGTCCCCCCCLGVPAPLQGPASGTYLLSIDEGGQKASWALKLCDIQQYMASHLHVVSVTAAIDNWFGFRAADAWTQGSGIPAGQFQIESDLIRSQYHQGLNIIRKMTSCSAVQTLQGRLVLGPLSLSLPACAVLPASTAGFCER